MSRRPARALWDEDDLAVPPRRPELKLVPTEPEPERRTVVITGQRPAPRRRPAAEPIAGHPDRIAMWGFLLGLFLVVVALATG